MPDRSDPVGRNPEPRGFLRTLRWPIVMGIFVVVAGSWYVTADFWTTEIRVLGGYRDRDFLLDLVTSCFALPAALMFAVRAKFKAIASGIAPTIGPVFTDQFGLRNPVGIKDPRVFVAGDSTVVGLPVPNNQSVGQGVGQLVNQARFSIGGVWYSSPVILDSLNTAGLIQPDEAVAHLVSEGNDGWT